MLRSFVFISISVAFFLGLHQFAFKNHVNECEMTYMSYYPEFVEIKLNKDIKKNFPRYNLFVYGEGPYVQQLRRGDFRGNPVIFIPGNAGSYKQVRSLGTIAQLMYTQGVLKYQLDFFTIDFNEERAGLFGDVLKDQITFVRKSLAVIRSLYAKSNPSRKNVSFVVIGHSIGGVISRGLVTEETFDPTCIEMLITLSAPHLRPVISMDDQMVRLYDFINDRWSKLRLKSLEVRKSQNHEVMLKNRQTNSSTLVQLQSNTKLGPKEEENGSIDPRKGHKDASEEKSISSLNQEVKKMEKQVNGFSNLIHVSIAGGFNDVLVRSELSMVDTSRYLHFKPGSQDKLSINNDNINSFGLINNDISLVSTAIPDVWLSMDHLSIVWCRQFITKLIRLISDVIKYSSTEPRLEASLLKYNIVKYHLFEANRNQMYPNYTIPSKIHYPSLENWVEVVKRCDTIFRPNVLDPIYVLIKLYPSTEVILVLDGDVRVDNWVSACNVTGIKKHPTSNLNMKTCESGINLTPSSRILPSLSANIPRKLLITSADTLIAQGLSHMNVALKATSSSINLMTERFVSTKRSKVINLPSMLYSLITLFKSETILNIPVSDQVIYQKLILKDMTHVWNNYLVRIETGSCYKKPQTSSSFASLRFHVPWNVEDVYKTITSQKGSLLELTVKLNTPRPLQLMSSLQSQEDKSSSGHPFIELFLHPDCNYIVSLKQPLIESIGSFIRFYSQFLLQFICAILTSVVFIQLLTRKSSSLFCPVEIDDAFDGQCDRECNVLDGNGHDDDIETKKAMADWSSTRLITPGNLNSRTSPAIDRQEVESLLPSTSENSPSIKGSKSRPIYSFVPSIESTLRNHLVQVSLSGCLLFLPTLVLTLLQFIPQTWIDNYYLFKYVSSLRPSGSFDFTTLACFIAILYLFAFSLTYVLSLILLLALHVLASTSIFVSSTSVYKSLERRLTSGSIRKMNDGQSQRDRETNSSLESQGRSSSQITSDPKRQAGEMELEELEMKDIRKNSRQSRFIKPPQVHSALPLVLALFLIIMAFITASGLSLMVAFVIHVLFLARMTLHSAFLQSKCGSTISSTKHHLQVTITILLFIAILGSFPLVIHWFNLGCPLFNFCPPFHPSPKSKTDHHLIPIVIIICCLTFIWRSGGSDFLHTRNRFILRSSRLRMIAKSSLNLASILFTLLGHNVQFLPSLIAFVLVIAVGSQTSATSLDLKAVHSHQE